MGFAFRAFRVVQVGGCLFSFVDLVLGDGVGGFVFDGFDVAFAYSGYFLLVTVLLDGVFVDCCFDVVAGCEEVVRLLPVVWVHALCWWRVLENGEACC